jgi:hypothetical protein
MEPSSLPLPRLQITWNKKLKSKVANYHVSYSLFLPVSKYDIRDDEHKGFLELHMSGGTDIDTSSGPIMQDGVLDTPFRDGAHISLDSVTLGLPSFVVYGDVVRRLGGTEIIQSPTPNVCLKLRD